MMTLLETAFLGRGYQLEALEAHLKSAGKSLGLIQLSDDQPTASLPEGCQRVVVANLSAAEEEWLAPLVSQGVEALSVPGYVRLVTPNKQRILIAGTTNKKSVMGMALTALLRSGREVDYLLPMGIEGVDSPVKLTDAPIIIMQGSDIPASKQHQQPAFADYGHHIALITGVTWEHALHYPTQEAYVKQFDLLADATPKAGTLLYDESDSLASMICQKERPDVAVIDYKTHPYQLHNGTTTVKDHEGREVELQVFGQYNMTNLAGAKALTERIGLSAAQFYAAAPHFAEAPVGLKRLGTDHSVPAYMAAGYSPTAVDGYVSAAKERHPEYNWVAALEIPLDLGLNRDFLQHYNRTLDQADQAFVFVQHDTLKKSGLEDISDDDLRKAFNRSDLQVFHDVEPFINELLALEWDQKGLVLLWTSRFMDSLIQRLSDKIL